jgi:hypothetical protein
VPNGPMAQKWVAVSRGRARRAETQVSRQARRQGLAGEPIWSLPLHCPCSLVLPFPPFLSHTETPPLPPSPDCLVSTEIGCVVQAIPLLLGKYRCRVKRLGVPFY